MCYRNDRPGTAGGGTGVAVRLNLEHHRVVLPAMTHLEGTAVELLNTLGGVQTVSYTHLDVYKRQCYDKVSENREVMHSYEPSAQLTPINYLMSIIPEARELFQSTTAYGSIV